MHPSLKHVFDPRAHLGNLRQLGIWLLLVPPVAALAGSASAFFLWALDGVTTLRFDHPWLLFLLPVSGAIIVWMYQGLGGDSERGTNLLLDEIHEPGGGVPARMAPLVLITTLITHLFGGSAGREGTAVQMGGSLAAGFVHAFRVAAIHRRVLLMSGVAAGFGAVFGTPLAGAVFAMEVLAMGRIRYDALVPCLLAGIVGDLCCTAWGIRHTQYHIDLLATSLGSGLSRLDLLLLAKVALAGVLFGLTGRLFAESTHALQTEFKRRISLPWMRPVIGGLGVIALTYLVGTRTYLGLGVSSPVPSDITILSSFHLHGATQWSWFWKLLFTVLTLSSGFKGGEVTPLFFIGATLGNALSEVLHAPVDLFAGLGFVAVFAGASNTPIACTLMGIELFGSDSAVYLATACFLAYLFSGHSGIYGAQRVGTPKLLPHDHPEELTLAELRKRP